MASEKRCHYEVLGLSRECTAEEIRSAYKKLALQRHPDKLVQSGLSQAEATAQFQELAQAYEVLSDPKERAWYDSHRSQILFSDPNSANSVPNSVIPNLFSFFSNTVYSGYTDSGKGFYKVYSDLFNNIYANEVTFCKKLGLGLESVREAPVMGNLQSPYEQVTAFYNYWFGFSTVMDFCWVDQYDVMAGPNRKSRRVMEEENKKLRKKARREYNETVRGLAEFVKKRDKRVIDMMVKKNAEMEKRKEEEKERRRKLEREKMERAKAYKEPEWAQVNEEEVEEIEGLEEEEESERGDRGKKEDLYCVVCGKKFKSEKQWKNHEQSKKHKERMAELKKSFVDEEDMNTGDLEENEEERNEHKDYNLDKMAKTFNKGFKIEEEGNGGSLQGSSDEEGGFFDVADGEDLKEVGKEDGYGDSNDDDNGKGDAVVLEAMVAEHKSRKNRRPKPASEDLPVAIDEDIGNEEEVIEYDNRKGRRRRGKKEKGRNDAREDAKGGIFGSMNTNKENDQQDGDQVEDSCSPSIVNDGNDGRSNNHFVENHMNSNQSPDKKGAIKKETATKSKNSSKVKKGKALSKNSGNLCDTCGEEFGSRNKLHKHLGDTGHATLKYR